MLAFLLCFGSIRGSISHSGNSHFSPSVLLKFSCICHVPARHLLQSQHLTCILQPFTEKAYYTSYHTFSVERAWLCCNLLLSPSLIRKARRALLSCTSCPTSTLGPQDRSSHRKDARLTGISHHYFHKILKSNASNRRLVT